MLAETDVQKVVLARPCASILETEHSLPALQVCNACRMGSKGLPKSPVPGVFISSVISTKSLLRSTLAKHVVHAVACSSLDFLSGKPPLPWLTTAMVAEIQPFSSFKVTP